MDNLKWISKKERDINPISCALKKDYLWLKIAVQRIKDSQELQNLQKEIPDTDDETVKAVLESQRFFLEDVMKGDSLKKAAEAFFDDGYNWNSSCACFDRLYSTWSHVIDFQIENIDSWPNAMSVTWEDCMDHEFFTAQVIKCIDNFPGNGYMMLNIDNHSFSWEDEGIDGFVESTRELLGSMVEMSLEIDEKLYFKDTEYNT